MNKNSSLANHYLFQVKLNKMRLRQLLFLAIILSLQACISSPEKVTTVPALICVNAQQYANQVIGDGHCVSLIKYCSKAPDTRYWRPGAKVLGNPALVPGAIIATFKNGRYPSHTGYHAAIYIRHDHHGIWVWDQWQGKAVHQRYIRLRHDGTTPNNSAQAYRVVQLQDGG